MKLKELPKEWVPYKEENEDLTTYRMYQTPDGRADIDGGPDFAHLDINFKPVDFATNGKITPFGEFYACGKETGDPRSDINDDSEICPKC